MIRSGGSVWFKRDVRASPTYAASLCAGMMTTCLIADSYGLQTRQRHPVVSPPQFEHDHCEDAVAVSEPAIVGLQKPVDRGLPNTRPVDSREELPDPDAAHAIPEPSVHGHADALLERKVARLLKHPARAAHTQ